MTAALKLKQKKCRVCKELYMTGNTLQIVCSVRCANLHAIAEREKKAKADAKKERQANREAKQKLKPRSKHLKDTKDACHQYIRLRDEGLPCISCGRNDGEVRAQVVGGTWDAGHFRSVGSCPELRFEALNIHRQCKQCNRDKSGNAVEYRKNLIERIGLETVEWIEGPHQSKHYSIDDLNQIKAKYKKLTLELKRSRGK